MAKIYLIVNKKNGKKYVGQTTNVVAVRFCQHIDSAYRNSANKRRSDFLKDLKESGESVFEDFYYKILEECSEEDKLKREVFYIHNIKPEYNENYKAEYIKSIEDKIVDEYKEGANITELRKKYKCRHQLIAKIVKKAIEEKRIKKHNSNSNNKKVYLFNSEGEIISEWASAGQCSLEIDIDRGNIRGCAYKNSKDNILYFKAENLYFKYDKNVPKDLYEIQKKEDGKILRFKTKEALVEYFKKVFPNKKIAFGQLVRDRKTVYGYVIKKIHNKRYF